MFTTTEQYQRRVETTILGRMRDSQGLPIAPVTDLTLRDCQFSGVTQASIIRYTREVKLEKVSVNDQVAQSL